MNTFKLASILVGFSLIVGSISGFLIGKKIYKKEPKVVEVVVEKTVYKKPDLKKPEVVKDPVKCEALRQCYISPLTADWQVDRHYFSNDVIRLNMHDDCKSAEARIEIASTTVSGIKMGIGITFGAALVTYGGYKLYKKLR